MQARRAPPCGRLRAWPIKRARSTSSATPPTPSSSSPAHSRSPTSAGTRRSRRSTCSRGCSSAIAGVVRGLSAGRRRPERGAPARRGRPEAAVPGGSSGVAYVSPRLLDLLGARRAGGDPRQVARTVGIEHLLHALAQEIRGPAGEILSSFGIGPGAFRPHARGAGRRPRGEPSPAPAETRRERGVDPRPYVRDLVADAREGRFDPVIGRDVEARRLLQILERRFKNHPLIVGEPGVGKTALIRGLADRIARGDVPTNLAGAQPPRARHRRARRGREAPRRDRAAPQGPRRSAARRRRTRRASSSSRTLDVALRPGVQGSRRGRAPRSRSSRGARSASSRRRPPRACARSTSAISGLHPPLLDDHAGGAHASSRRSRSSAASPRKYEAHHQRPRRRARHRLRR